MFFYIETNYLPYIIRPDQNLDLFDVLQLGNRTNRKKVFHFIFQHNHVYPTYPRGPSRSFPRGMYRNYQAHRPSQ